MIDIKEEYKLRCIRFFGGWFPCLVENPAMVVTPKREVLLCDVYGGNSKCAEMCPTGAIQFADRAKRVAGSSDKTVVDMFKT